METTNEFDINYRELLACAFTVHAWAELWHATTTISLVPVHVHFRIDNTPAVAWQTKMSSITTRAQTIIRLLGYWEMTFGLRFSSSRMA